MRSLCAIVGCHMTGGCAWFVTELLDTTHKSQRKCKACHQEALQLIEMICHITILVELWLGKYPFKYKVDCWVVKESFTNLQVRLVYKYMNET